MFGAIDFAAIAVLFMAQLPAFLLRHMAIGFGFLFILVKFFLAPFIIGRFPRRQLAGFDAIGDTPLLAMLPPGNNRRFSVIVGLSKNKWRQTESKY
jgi:hypothetical protein